MSSLPKDPLLREHPARNAGRAGASGEAIDTPVIDPGPEAPVSHEDEVMLLGLIEASIFASPEPISLKRLARAVGETEDRVGALVENLTRSYEDRSSGLMIRQIAGGYQIVTRPEHRHQLEAIVETFQPAPLSLPALETLATIAYKQPTTAAEVQAIRGVQGTGVLKTLLRRKLIAPAGRKSVAGKPVLYKTTKRFLMEFGLKDLSDLPAFEDFEQVKKMRFESL